MKGKNDGTNDVFQKKLDDVEDKCVESSEVEDEFQSMKNDSQKDNTRLEEKQVKEDTKESLKTEKTGDKGCLVQILFFSFVIIFVYISLINKARQFEEYISSGQVLRDMFPHPMSTKEDASDYTDMFYPFPRSPKEKKEQILAHMKKKYNEEFEFSQEYPEEDILIHKRTFYVNPVGKKEDYIAVECRYDEEGHYFFIDSYFCLAIKDRYTKYVRDLLDGFYSEYFLTIDWVYERDTFPDRFRGDMPINEIYSPGDFNYWTRIYIYIPQRMLNHKSIKDNAWMIAEKFLEHNLHCRVYLYTIRDEKYAEFKEKEGNIYPPKEDPDYYAKVDQIDNQLFIKDDIMEKDCFEISIGHSDDLSKLEIRWYTGKKRKYE